MQPWEKEKRNKKPKSVGDKVKFFTKGIGLGVACCTVIYGSIIYSSLKHVFVGDRSEDAA